MSKLLCKNYLLQMYKFLCIIHSFSFQLIYPRGGEAVRPRSLSIILKCPRYIGHTLRFPSGILKWNSRGPRGKGFHQRTYMIIDCMVRPGTPEGLRGVCRNHGNPSKSPLFSLFPPVSSFGSFSLS